LRKPAAAATSFGGTEQGLKHGKNAKGTHAKILQRLKRQSTTRPCIIIMDTCPNTLYVHILSPAPLITFHSAPTCCDQSSERERKKIVNYVVRRRFHLALSNKYYHGHCPNKRPHCTCLITFCNDQRFQLRVLRLIERTHGEDGRRATTRRPRKSCDRDGSPRDPPPRGSPGPHREARGGDGPFRREPPRVGG